MNVKEKVLVALEGSRERYLSGETLAKQLGVSRQAVWKAVNELKQDGYEIISIPHKGHTLNGGDILSAVYLSQLTGVACEHLSEVTSTNELAKQWLASATPHLIVANSQTQGKATNGAFPSPVNGVYFSLTLPLAVPFENVHTLQRQWANEIIQAVAKHCGVACDLLNDREFWANGHKVGGMLCEWMVNTNTLSTSAVVVGVGLYTQVNALPLLPVETRNNLIATIVDRIKT